MLSSQPFGRASRVECYMARVRVIRRGSRIFKTATTNVNSSVCNRGMPLFPSYGVGPRYKATKLPAFSSDRRMKLFRHFASPKVMRKQKQRCDSANTGSYVLISIYCSVVWRSVQVYYLKVFDFLGKIALFVFSEHALFE